MAAMGRPRLADLAIEDERDERTARTAEKTETLAEIVNLSQYLFRVSAIYGERPAMGAAAKVRYLAQRELERNDPKDAA